MSGATARELLAKWLHEVVGSCHPWGDYATCDCDERADTILTSPALDAIVAERVAALAEEFATGAWLDAFMTGKVHDDESAVRAVERWFLGRVGLTERRSSDG